MACFIFSDFQKISVLALCCMLSVGCSQEKTAEENVREPEKNAVSRTSEETVSVLPTANAAEN